MSYNRQQARREREGLLDSVLPAPTHPRAKPRALATSVLAIFFLLVIYMAATETSTSAKDKKEVWEPAMQRWVWESSVEMGSATVAGQDEQAQKQESEVAALDETENDDGADSDGEDDKVDTEMKSGLSKYIWHEDLEWDADGSGRLIVVGDVHGMIKELK